MRTLLFLANGFETMEFSVFVVEKANGNRKICYGVLTNIISILKSWLKNIHITKTFLRGRTYYVKN